MLDCLNLDKEIVISAHDTFYIDTWFLLVNNDSVTIIFVNIDKSYNTYYYQ